AAAWSQTRSATGLRYTPFALRELFPKLRVQRYGIYFDWPNFSYCFSSYIKSCAADSLHFSP
ncbi:hypothetical protein, partial [Segatella baroniae]|uniref:hypothetical protein n=1 Tax=Segatella baroniae TaxID=305719 RepID=UPI0028EB0DCC